MKSLFSEEQIKETKYWAEIFQKFLRVDENTLQELANFIDNTDIIHYPSLCHFLYLSLELRPFKSILYTKLLTLLRSSNKNIFYHQLLSDEIFSPSIYPYFPNSPKYSFLFDCLNYDPTKPIYEISEVYNEFKKSIETQQISSDEILVCYAWISPEISNAYGEKDEISGLVESIFKKNSSSIENIQNFYSKFNDYKSDNFKKLKEERSNPINDPIKRTILSKSPFNLNYQKIQNSEEFVLNDENKKDLIEKTIIFDSIFERCQYKFVNPTILQYCAYYNAYDIYDRLVENGANDDINDTAGNTIAHYSIAGVDGFHSKSETFVKKIEKKLDFRLTPEMATELNQNEIFQWLVDSVYYFKYMEQSILTISSSFSNLSILLYCIENTKFLIEKNIPIDFETPLFEAAQNGNVEVVKFLLPAYLKQNESKNVNFVKNEMNLFYAAFNKRRINMLNYFLKASSENMIVNSNFVYRGKQAIVRAVEMKQIDMIELLLKFPNIDVNVVCGGMTPLHLAAKDGNTEIVKILLDFEGTNPNISTVFNFVYFFNFVLFIFFFIKVHLIKLLRKVITMISLI